MHPVAMAAFANMTALSTSGHSRPFDARRDGFVMTEGAAALVLEDWDRAVARGATIYAELAGAASTADAHHITAPAPDGAGAVACMELALADAGIAAVRRRAHQRPRHLDAAQRPGRGTRHHQGVRRARAAGHLDQGRHRATGWRRPARSRPWPACSRSTTAPSRPRPATRSPTPRSRIQVVHGEPRPWEPAAVLSNSFGFGGHNGCLVLLPPG